MRTRYLPVFLLPILCMPLRAQHYHQPAEIVKIMTNSRITYNMNVSDTMKTEADIYRNNLVVHGYYLAKDDNGTVTLQNYRDQLSANDEASRIWMKAEQAFADGKPDEAEKYYREVLAILPDNSVIMTYLGQAIIQQHRREDGMEWWRRAIEVNPFDYMAHWFIADNYAQDGDIDKAMEHITRAHLLNRNNPRILASLENIYEQNGTPYDGWVSLLVRSPSLVRSSNPSLSASSRPTWWSRIGNWARKSASSLRPFSSSSDDTTPRGLLRAI